jgi:hypothetical protein
VSAKGSVKFNYNSAFIGDLSDSVLVEVAQVFDFDIRAMAVDLSPVKLGTNRRSITTEARRLPDGSIFAEIFTQSGYGGYLELGHKVRGAGKGGFDFESSDYVQGRPYIYPAFIANQDKLLAAVKSGVTNIGSSSSRTRLL